MTDWFYSGVVKEHFFKPKNIFKTEEELNKYEADGIGIVGSPACGDVMKFFIKVKDDRIVDCKWQTFGSLISGEKILLPDYSSEKVEKLSINSVIMNELGKPVIVEENLIRDYKGKILNLNLSTSKFYNLNVTPNHPIPCFDRTQVSRIKRKKGDRWSEIDDDKLQKAKSVLKSASQLKSGDFLIYKVNESVKDIEALDNDFCKLLGYYVSDGNLASKNRCIFYFGLTETEFINDLESLAKKKKWCYRVFKRNTENVLCFQLNEPKLIKLLRKHGGTPGKKIFSKEIMFLPPIKQMEIIDSYINGDGWVLKQNENWEAQYFISTAKENLAYQLQMMLARNLIFAPIHRREPRVFKSRGKEYQNKGEFNIIFRKNTQYSRIKYHKNESSFLIPIKEITSFDYRGKIFDIGLSKEPKVYKIKGLSVHNCASAIASTSMLSVMVTENGGMLLDDALRIKPQDIIARLDELPARKVHCSVLGHRALRAAINDYFKKTNQESRMVKDFSCAGCQNS